MLFLASVAGATWLALRRFERYTITGDSMEPALLDLDLVVVDTAAFRRRTPRAGEIVVARDPRLEERTVVKRVEHYSAEGAWLLGDNPGESTDSRTFGCVPPGLILGRVAWRYWPPGRFGRVE